VIGERGRELLRRLEERPGFPKLEYDGQSGGVATTREKCGRGKLSAKASIPSTIVC
jgi:hypothetical protein